MTYDEEINLIKYIIDENAMGDPIEIQVKRPVLASKLDYRNKDFYQAMANGLKPSITLGINKHEYDSEKEVEFEGKSYKVIDVFPVKTKDESEFESIALICEGLVNNNGTT